MYSFRTHISLDSIMLINGVIDLFVENPDFGKLSSMHFYAWRQGLKTGMYYLRSKAAVDPIKFTLKAEHQTKFNAKVAEPEMVEGEVCSMEDGCVMCSG